MKSFSITNGLITARISDYGAKILSLVTPTRSGEQRDIVLGFNTDEEWLNQEPYFNAIVGRYAGRIRDARFTLDGHTYNLAANNGPNALHGGIHGFNTRTWDVVALSRDSIRLHLFSPDGEEGYPGNLHVFVTYTVGTPMLQDGTQAPEGFGSLIIDYEAITDAPTVVNFTQHTYLNLAGEGAGDVRAHALTIDADTYAPADENTCPIGELRPVAGTPMDFRCPALLGERYDLPFFAPWRGIDSAWLLNAGLTAKPNATLSVPDLTLDLHTNMEALVVYSGNYVEQHRGKSGSMYDIRHAVCLEAQNLPAAPNFANFPSAVLRPGELYRRRTIYTLHE